MQEGEGWVKLFRKFTEWRWYGDANTKVVFLHLLLTANYEDKDWQRTTVKRGQVIVGRKELAERLGLSERNIRTALSRLEETGEITKKATNKYTIVTICNYDSYQQIEEAERPTTDQQLTNKRPTTDHNIRNKEYKNINSADADSVRAYACACERKPIEEYLTEVLMDDSWVEATCMNHSIDKFTLVKMSEDFKTECKCNGKETADSLQNAKQWFNSWLRIRLEAERKQEKDEQHGQQTTNGESQAERIARLWLK